LLREQADRIVVQRIGLLQIEEEDTDAGAVLADRDRGRGAVLRLRLVPTESLEAIGLELVAIVVRDRRYAGPECGSGQPLSMVRIRTDGNLYALQRLFALVAGDCGDAQPAIRLGEHGARRHEAAAMHHGVTHPLEQLLRRPGAQDRFVGGAERRIHP
jgi:hypothetical protein